MGSTKRQNIIHQHTEEFLLSRNYAEQLKTIFLEADKVYDDKKISAKNILFKIIYFFQKFFFIMNKRRKLLLKRYSNLF